MILSALAKGAAAGAAGTTALNAVTYLDMAARGRPASDTPERAVEEISRRLHRPIPGDGIELSNRVEGLGALGGIATGIGVGLAVGLFSSVVTRLPGALAALLVGGAAMAAGDAPLVRLGISEPSGWSATDWLSDIGPHVAYGAAAVYTLRRLHHH